ncbi:MAG TPA: 23S rRNA (uridine(2552)-2'-O)-methyltransferase RlmE [Steroidobacteraceae bacterium]|jgi:23S rRNA (uridine2552-2'-O)-methyltransferase|nr:23S rRNA (uridine(2552)-2'-O)-methyltransferase RlmE [Steroidobacteraceae bacterium]
MARSKSSGNWLQRHVNDPYVKQAQKDGYRSRASYKLLQLHDKDRLIQPGMLVVDLGSAPGGWSQVAGNLVGARGKVVATDILAMEPVKNVDFIQGDFREPEVLNQILECLSNRKPDLIISDLAPNISGIPMADQAASMYLVELALDLARQVLKSKGTFVAKVFQGAGSEDYLRELRRSFEKLTIRKPPASRPKSSEIYVVARGFKATAPEQSAQYPG